MLSVVIETNNHEEALARTLSALVSAAVEGMVRDVLVLGRGSTDDTASVAEHSGCVFLADADLTSALQQARGDWLLLLRPGARLVEGWSEEVRRHIAAAGTPACFTQGNRRWPWAALFDRRGLDAGLVISRQQALSLAGAGMDGHGLARRVRAKRLQARIASG